MRMLDQETDDSEGLSEINPAVQSDLQGDANRYFNNTLGGRLTSLSSTRQKFDAADLAKMRVPTRDLLRMYARDFAADPAIKGEVLAFADTVSSGTVIDQRELTYLQLAHGLNPLAWATRERKPKAVDNTDLTGTSFHVDRFGRVIFDDVLIGSTRDDVQLDGSLKSDKKLNGTFADSLELDGTVRDSVQLGMDDYSTDDVNPYPRVPKRKTTLVDGMSVLSILNQPKAFNADEIEALFQRIGDRDPFAASVLGQTKRGTLRSDWLITEATAKEAQRILNQELGLDLTYKGVDLSRPADWLHRDGPNIELDPARALLVNGLVDLAVSYAQSNKLAAGGTLDLMQPFGLVPQDRGYRSENGQIASFVGKIQAAVGQELTPYMLDLKDPILAMAFPLASNWKTRGQSPVQDYAREAGNFLLSWLIPGTNVRDIEGRHWVPKDLRASVYGTINNLREEFGAPRMGTLLTDEAQIRPVSFLLNPSPDAYSRGWFGFNPFGDKLMGWDKVRNAVESQVIENPVLSSTSTMSKMSFIGGRFLDPYLGQEVDIGNSYKLQSIEWNDKRGKWQIRAPRVSDYQLDHVLPLAYLWEHGYDKISEEIIRLSEATPNGATIEAPSFLRDAAIIGARSDGSSLPTGGSPERTHAIELLEFMSRAGLAANPDQFRLVTAKLNTDKGAKGPGSWMPFQYVDNSHDHAVNVEYVRSFRSVLASERANFEKYTGRIDPNFLREDREDKLAMRRVDLGLDSTGRFTRWAADAYLNYIDSPNLEDPTLYHRIRAWSMVAEAKFGMSLAFWQFVPANQMYLRARQYIVSGFGGSFLKEDGGSMRDRSAAFWRWVRERQVGTPFLGARPVMPGVGDDALLTLHDIARSGKVQNIVRASDGEAIRSFSGRMYAADPSSMWKHAGGEADAFGAEVVRGARRREVSSLPEFGIAIRSEYERLIASHPLANFWQDQLSDLGRVADAAHGRIPMESGSTMELAEDYIARASRFFLEKKALDEAKAGAQAEFMFTSTSQLGRELLNPTPFIQEIGQLFRSGDYRKMSKVATLELLVKLADYGVKGSLGVFSQLPTILVIEAAASKGSSAIGVMADIRPEYGKYDFSGYKGGLFGWYRSHLDDLSAQRAASLARARAAIASIREARAQLAPLRSALDRLDLERSLSSEVQWRDAPSRLKGMSARRLSPRLDPVEHADHLQQVRSQFARQLSAEEEARKALQDALGVRRTIDFKRTRFVTTVEEEAAWIPELERAPGMRGRILRFAAEHPRATYNVSKIRNVPGDFGRAMLAPARLHLAVSDWLESSTRLFPESGRIGSFLERNKILRVANKVASVRTASRVAGGALNALGFLEIGVRHLEANRLASTSWERLSTADRGGLEAYLYPTAWEATKERILDVGIPLVPSLAVLGAAQALTREASRAQLRAKIPILRDEVVRRAVFNLPTLLSDSRIEAQLRRNRSIGLVDSALVALNPVMARDSGAYISQIRKVGSQREDSQAKIDKEIEKVRKAFSPIPRTDSLGYGPGKRMGGEFQRALFQQAPMHASDNSVYIPRRGKEVAVSTEKPQARGSFDRARILAEEATELRRKQLLAITNDKKRSFFERFGAAAMAVEAGPRDLSGGVHADSAALVKEMVLRDSLRTAPRK